MTIINESGLYSLILSSKLPSTKKFKRWVLCAAAHNTHNIEDFLAENVRELTKPLFSIPTHHFLFYPGTIEKKIYMDTL